MVYPEPNCNLSDSGAHHWRGQINLDKGCLFRCKFCKQWEWLPLQLSECMKMTANIKMYGRQEGYQLYMASHSEARQMLIKLQDIYFLGKMLSDDTYAKTIVAIMTSKEYGVEVV